MDMNTATVMDGDHQAHSKDLFCKTFEIAKNKKLKYIIKPNMHNSTSYVISLSKNSDVSCLPRQTLEERQI